MVEIKSGVINIENVVVRKNVLSGIMQYSFGYVRVTNSHSDYDAKGGSLGLTIRNIFALKSKNVVHRVI